MRLPEVGPTLLCADPYGPVMTLQCPDIYLDPR